VTKLFVLSDTKAENLEEALLTVVKGQGKSVGVSLRKGGFKGGEPVNLSRFREKI